MHKIIFIFTGAGSPCAQQNKGAKLGRFEERFWESNPNAHSKHGRSSGPYRAYIPQKLCEGVPIAADVAKRAGRLERRINAAFPTKIASGLESIARLLVRREAVASSKIEGLQTSAKKLAQAELALNLGEAGEGSGTAYDVVRNIKAHEDAVNSLAASEETTLADLERIQQTIVDRKEICGLRQTQNWLGGDKYHPLDAEYVPPPPEYVQPLLEDLTEYIDGATHGALIQAALVHAQFESIHPFADGNGRLGRILIHVVLARRGLLLGPLPISVVLQTQSEAYAKGLMSFREGEHAGGQGVNTWLRAFLGAVEIAIDNTKSLQRELDELVKGWKQQYLDYYAAEHKNSPRADSAPIRLLDSLPQMPIFTVELVQERLDLSRQSARKACSELEQAGIIGPTSASARSRGWWHQGLFELITHSERKLASSRWDTRLSPPELPVPHLPGRQK